MRRHDLRLVPIAAAAWAAAWIGTSGWAPERAGWLAGLVGVALLAVIAWRAGRIWVAMVLAVLGVTLLAAGTRSWQLHTSPVADLAAVGAVATVEFEVLAEPAPASRVVVGRARLLRVESRGLSVRAAVPVVVLASGGLGERLAALEPGSRHEARARLASPDPADPEAAVLSLRSIGRRTGEPGPLRAVANSMRAGLRDAVGHSPPDQAALVPSLVVGDTSRVDDDLRADFRATGLTHLMAVSGANLTLMLGVLLAFVRAVGLRGWWVRVAAVGGVGLFVLLCGQEPSVLRATAMGLVALAATGIGSGSRSTGSLCLAVTVLVWCDPWLSRSVGFALSVCACAGIVLVGPVFRAALLRWCPRWIAEALAVSLAAQLATQPIVTAISEEISVVGVGANVVAAPFVGPTTVLGLSAAALSWLPGIAVVPGWLAGWAAQPILWVARAGAAAPSATWGWRTGALGVAVLTVAVVLLGLGLMRLLRTPVGGVVFVALLVGAAFVRPVPLGWPGRWEVVFCDVGQGDATVIRAGPGAAMVVDAGPDAVDLLGCLSDLGVREVPVLLLTHYHADHTGGAEALIGRFTPSLVLVRGGEPPRWLVEAVARSGGELRSAVEGEELVVGGARWITVSAPGPLSAVTEQTDAEGSPENDASVVGIAEAGGVRVLLAGDAEPPGQARALRSARGLGVSLSVEVLKLPHHGSARQEERFFRESAASLAVASAGEGNEYGHPAQAALDLATGMGMALARTDLQGAVAVARSEDRLTVNAEKG